MFAGLNLRQVYNFPCFDPQVGTGAPNGQPYAYGPYIPFTNVSAHTWAKGYGTVNFLLPNIRCAYEFLYLQRSSAKNGTSVSVPVTAPAKVTFPKAQPIGIHLAFTNSKSEVSVTWNSDTKSSGGVNYRKAGTNDAWQTSSIATTTTYSANDLCGSEAAQQRPQNFIDPGYVRVLHLATYVCILPFLNLIT